VVKEIHITLDMDEYQRLVEAKGKKTWRTVLMEWLAFQRFQLKRRGGKKDEKKAE